MGGIPIAVCSGCNIAAVVSFISGGVAIAVCHCHWQIVAVVLVILGSTVWIGNAGNIAFFIVSILPGMSQTVGVAYPFIFFIIFKVFGAIVGGIGDNAIQSVIFNTLIISIFPGTGIDSGISIIGKVENAFPFYILLNDTVIFIILIA